VIDARAFAEPLRARIGDRIRVDASLAPFTTFRVGGPADVLVEPESVDDLVALADVVGGRVPIAIVGRGSNLLVADGGFRGIAVRLGRAFRDHERLDDGLRFGGAVSLPAAARLTARHGLAGFEFAAEIPATFGGAVRMNAGAHGRSMSDVLVHADVVDLASGTTRRIPVSALGYAYRRSDLGPHELVTSGRIRLEPGDPDEVASRIAEHIRWRREHQPPGRSAGSVFMNPPGDSAGRLIDAVGAKGWSVGGAEVSAVHANFVVVSKEATATDVWTLIRRVYAAVADRFGIDLECEVRFLGTFSEDEGELET